MQSHNKTKKLTDSGALIALAFIIGYFESLLPVFIPIPGIKIGLANLVVVVALYHFGVGMAFRISFVRILLTGFTFGSVSSMLYGMAGGMLSLLLMVILKKTNCFSVIGISMAGGVFHNVGQLLMALLVLETPALMYYFPVLLCSGMITGVFVGIVAHFMEIPLKKWKIVENR